MTKSKKLVIAIIIGAVLAVFFAFRIPIKESVQEMLKAPLPEAKVASEFENKNVSAGIEDMKTDETKTEDPLAANAVVAVPLPESVNLDIPFVSQAPHGNWDLPYQETCEEAAIIMTHRFLAGEDITPDSMDEDILKLVEWENKRFGYYKDTTAEEIAIMLREYFKRTDIEVIYNFTIEDIKREVADGHPVVLPAAGRLLPNPNFKQPGPIYHALVVKGYTREKIITNDPGTRRGADFLYYPEDLMNAIHDWDPDNILNGKKVMIVVKG